jgi:hypothetical protein
MGVRWERNRKPHEFLNKKRKELRDDVIPDVARDVAQALKDEVRRRTPHGVKWVPYGAPFAAPVKTSNLIKSIDKDRKGRWDGNSYLWTVSTDKSYAPYVEYGTSPHVIRAKPGSSLVYYLKGDQEGSKEVEHPGTRPVLMFTRGVATIRPKAGRIGSIHVQKWAQTG